MTTPEGIIADASAAVHGDRQDDYGKPQANHKCTAALWSTYLHRCGIVANLTPRNVCMMNILQKVSRDANVPKRDNLVDIAGYAENAGMCDE